MTCPDNNLNEIRMEVIRDLDVVDQYADRWNHLALLVPQGIPTMSYAWVKTYFEYFLNPGESWSCILALRGDELLGALPVVVTPGKNAGGNLPLLRTPFNLHTASVDFVLKEGISDRIVSLMIEELEKVAPDRLGLELIRIPASSPTLKILGNSIRNSIIIKEFNGKGSFIDTTGSFEDYKKGLGRNFTRNLTKARNKIAKLPDIETLFLSGTAADDKEIQTLMKVEAAGWKGRAGTAIISSPALQAFYTTLTRRLAELGWLEWHILLTGNRPIAMHLAIKINRTLVINKIGYDEEFSRCSPGNILFERTLKRAFASDDTDEVDCLTDMAWHNNWNMSKRDFFDIWIYPRRLSPIIYGILPKEIRRWGRRMPFFKSAFKRIRSVVKRG